MAVSNTTKPLRKRVEVMIWRDGLLLVTYGTGATKWFGLPGGGIDDGEHPIESVIREALEEVGVAIKNICNTKRTHVGPNPFGVYGARANDYSGVHTALYHADYSHDDGSLFGNAGDARQYLWMTPQEALDAFNSHNPEERPHRILELQSIINK